MLPWCASRPRCVMATWTRRAPRRWPSPGKLQWMLSKSFPGDPGEFMRNRYIVTVATALMAILLVAATGCKGNPEKAKKKYLESGLSYMDKKQYDAAVIQFKKALQVDPNYADAHYQLGLTYMRQQRWKEAYLELMQTTHLD